MMKVTIISTELIVSQKMSVWLLQKDLLKMVVKVELESSKLPMEELTGHKFMFTLKKLEDLP